MSIGYWLITPAIAQSNPKLASTPHSDPIYGLSEPELEALCTYLVENVAKGFIQPSKSAVDAPILFVKKRDESLCLCVDYGGLNKGTVCNLYSLPLIPTLLARLKIRRIFSKIDLRGAYNLVRIKPGDEWKTVFWTCYGHFEYKVMSFNLTKTSTVFQHMMNNIFSKSLDHFMLIYLDDILVLSSSLEEHTHHVQVVLNKLREYGLFPKS